MSARAFALSTAAIGAALTLNATATERLPNISCKQQTKYSVSSCATTKKLKQPKLKMHGARTKGKSRLQKSQLPVGGYSGWGCRSCDLTNGTRLRVAHGAASRCISMGYLQWQETQDGPPLRALHTACVNMIRADYGGGGTSYTREGVKIAFCDRSGINPCRDTTPLTFEAGWGTKGATCVAHTRVPELMSVEQLVERYRHLKSVIGRDSCDGNLALQDEAALTFSRSTAREIIGCWPMISAISPRQTNPVLIERVCRGQTNHFAAT